MSSQPDYGFHGRGFTWGSGPANGFQQFKQPSIYSNGTGGMFNGDYNTGAAFNNDSGMGRYMPNINGLPATNHFSDSSMTGSDGLTRTNSLDDENNNESQDSNMSNNIDEAKPPKTLTQTTSFTEQGTGITPDMAQTGFKNNGFDPALYSLDGDYNPVINDRGLGLDPFQDEHLPGFDDPNLADLAQFGFTA
jgi:hypothetical protein